MRNQLLFSSFLLLFSTISYGQTDTKFWFVAPEVSAAHGDIPIQMRFSTTSQTAIVTISQPANPSFLTQTVTVNPNSTQSVNLTTQKTALENIPANQVLSKGLLIESTVPVTAYYEVANSDNPEIFPLKGSNALGTSFFVPAQNSLYNEVGEAAVDIVATENNTTITIIPTDNIIGHTANIPFTITLNQGETYSARAINTAAPAHLGGTKITANKPIAVTVSDDSVRRLGGFGWDLLGDQIVPVSILGTDYIAIKGNSTAEMVYVVATQDNTTIMLNGSPNAWATINEGDLIQVPINLQTVYIQTNHPVYAYHISGFQDEFGDALLPHLICTGSSEVGFVRTTSNSFSMLVLTETANISNFSINGGAGILTASDFAPVTGTNGQWSFTIKSMGTGQIPVGANRITNSSGLFHVGILNNLGLSAEYGYFSNYSQLFLGDNQNACFGDTVQLDAGGNLSNFVWNTGETTQSIEVNQTGLYSVSANLFNCLLTDTVEVIFNDIELGLGNDTTFCIGSDLLLDATQPHMTYEWQDGSTTAFYNVLTPGTYSVTVTDTLGCTAADTILTTYHPAIDLGSDQVFLCDSSTFTIFPSFTQGTFLWQDGSTNPTFTADTLGTYSVVHTDLNTCVSSDTINLFPPTYPSLDFGNDTILCVGDSLVLNASIPMGRSFIWQDGVTDATYPVFNTGIYHVAATDSNGCKAFDTIQILFHQVTVNLNPDTSICFDDTIQLNAFQQDMEFLWSTGETTASIQVNLDTMYWVELTDTMGCKHQDTFYLTHHPVADLGNDIVFVCDSLFFPLEPKITHGTFLWQDGSMDSIFFPIEAGTYWVAITDTNGCFSTDTVTLIPVTSPNIDLGRDTNICFGDTVRIEVTTPFIRSYTWQDSSTNPFFNTIVTDLVYVEVIDSHGCSSEDTMMIWVNQVVPNLGIDTSICTTDSLQLDATQPLMTYLWQDGSTQPTFIADTGIYYVELTDTLGCKGQDTIHITHRPTANLGPDIIFICDSLTFTLDPQMVNSLYTWSNSLNDSVLVSNLEGTYHVDVIDEKGCSSSDTITVTQITHPTVNLGMDTTFCGGITYTIDVTTPFVRHYLWQDGSTAPTLHVINTGIYHVELTDSFGCKAFDTVLVNVNTVEVDLGNDTAICHSSTLQFNVFQSGLNYLWQDGSTTATYTASAEGQYHVTLVDSIGCSDQDTINLSHLPVIDLGEDRLFKCDSTQLTLLTNLSNGTYLWTDSSTSSFLVASDTGNYTVQFTNAQNCISYDTIALLPPPIPPIHLGNDTTLCEAETHTLSAFDETGRSYLWQDGSVNPTLEVSVEGFYYATITDTNGCTNTDSIWIDYFLSPLLDLGKDTFVCEFDTLFIDATTPDGVNYVWRNGATTPVIGVTQQGLQVVEVFDSVGCAISDSIYVERIIWPRFVPLPYDTTVCLGTPITLSAFEPNATFYNWMGDEAYVGQNDRSDTIFTMVFPGQYQVEIGNACRTNLQTINVHHQDCGCYPKVPDAFTPNYDGINDLLLSYQNTLCDGLIQDYQFSIFDRWGSHIFTTTDETEGWDGQQNGQIVAAGVYVWQLTFTGPTENGNIAKQVLHGNVTVVR